MGEIINALIVPITLSLLASAIVAYYYKCKQDRSIMEFFDENEDLIAKVVPFKYVFVYSKVQKRAWFTDRDSYALTKDFSLRQGFDMLGRLVKMHSDRQRHDYISSLF